MGVRFRKSIKLGKGVKLNLNKKSFGVSVGGKGAHLSINSKGRKSATFGIPGTGLSYTASSKSKSRNKRKRSSASSHTQSYAPVREMKTGLIPLLLTIFLGWAGAQYFISGMVGTGFLYLFTFGLFGFGWFVDVIRQGIAFVRILKAVEAEQSNYINETTKEQE